MRSTGFYGSTAHFPVHKDSTRKEVRFRPIARRQAARLFHAARRFERQTRIKGRQDGRLGRNGLAVLHAMLFDFIDYVSGRLDPGYHAIAHKACISVSSVARGIVKLKAAGVLNWVRRCHWNDDGTLEQDTNAYAVLELEQWKGFAPAASPKPEPGTWGDHPPIGGALELAAEALRAGNKRQAQAAFELEPRDELAAALGRINRARNGGAV